MTALSERIEREDEDDRLASLSSRFSIEDTAKALHAPDRLGLVVSLLMTLVDEDVLAGWHLSYPASRQDTGPC